jgi:hypothetical protein
MVWKPAKTLGLAMGLFFVLTILGVDAFLVSALIAEPIGLSMFLTALALAATVPLLLLWLHWFVSLLTLRYTLDRNALIIQCAGYRHTVPMGQIRGIASGDAVTVTQPFRGVGWPGYLRGQAQLQELGVLLVHATEPLRRQLVVVTDGICYGISPKDRERFVQDLERRQSLGTLHTLQPTFERLGIAALPVWHDQAFWLVHLVSVVADVAMFGLIAAQYRGLPARIPLRLGLQGEVTRIASKASLFLLPALGAATWLGNGLLALLLHRRERLAAYLMLMVTIVVHIVLWLAIPDALRW